jgi:hypothetical protein
MEERAKGSIRELLELTPEREKTLAHITAKCVLAGVTRDGDGVNVEQTDILLALEKEMDMTRREMIWTAMKAGEMSSRKETLLLLIMGRELGVFNKER